jgi:predicted RNase H-like HicB family nuclease
MGTIVEYMTEAMRRAQYEKLEDGTVYAHVPELTGLWAAGANFEEARNELSSALDGWLHVHGFHTGFPPPLGTVKIEAPSKIES